MRFLIYLFICNSIILIAQPDSTWKPDLVCFPAIDSLPKIIGDIESIQNRLIYPPRAFERRIEGKVYIRVKIDSLGIPKDPFLIKGIGGGCDEEAIRLVMTAKFSPAYDNGKYINVQISIPIRFKLPKNE